MSRERPINADEPATEEGKPREAEGAAAEAGLEGPPAAGKAAAGETADAGTEGPPAAATKDSDASAGPPAKDAERPAAGTPAAGEQRADGEPAPPQPSRRRRSIPGAIKAVAALVALAIVFIVAAVIGGSGGSSSDEQPAPAPAPSSEGGKSGDTNASTQTAAELGYPVFATDNTTRIGGSDPAANAAATALAVFPSTTASQRPAAVAIAAEDSWQSALGAAVLMAPPVRAPLLLSTADEVPDASAEALSALAPSGSADTQGSAIFAIGAVALDGEGKVTKLAPGDPAKLAAGIAALRERLAGPPRHYLVAPLSSPAFAAPAAAWAARSGDPVLFSGAAKLPEATAAVLKKHPEVPVYVLGPDSAVSSAVVNEIAKIGEDVHRVAGGDPVANAVAFARYHDGSFGWDINDPGHGFVLARDDSPLDAAAAAPLSASGTWGPLLLTDSAATLPDAVREYLLDVKPGYTTDPTRAFYNHVWVIGDQEAIDVNQQAEVNELAELARIGGEE